MVKLFNRALPTRSVFFCLTEDLLIWFSVVVSVLMFSLSEPSLHADGPLILAQGLILAALFHLTLYYSDLYDLSLFPPDQGHLIRLVRAGGIGLLILW